MASDCRAHLIVFAIIVNFSAISALTCPQQTEAKDYRLKPIKTVYPVYPNHLKEEGIAGAVTIKVLINERGEVKPVFSPIIVRQLHPELDKLALEAVKQWKYEPVLLQGKPIHFPTYITIIFDPEEPPEVQEPSPQGPMSSELTVLLDRCWEYSRKIDDVAHFYLCRERVSETTRNVVVSGPTFAWSSYAHPYASAGSNIPELGSSSRTSYINDYQVTSRDSLVTEQRTSIKPGAEERDSLFGKKPLFPPIPITIPSRLVAPGFRSEFSFSLGNEDKVLGRNCVIIEIKARKRRGTQIRQGAVWIEKGTYRVVKAEIEFSSYATDERILAECKRFYLTPHMNVTYEYGVEKKGILFPSRSEISLDYTGLGMTNKRETKEKLNIQYDHYRFFTVDTNYRIIK
jgi:TonB family protein